MQPKQDISHGGGTLNGKHSGKAEERSAKDTIMTSPVMPPHRPVAESTNKIITQPHPSMSSEYRPSHPTVPSKVSIFN